MCLFKNDVDASLRKDYWNIVSDTLKHLERKANGIQKVKEEIQVQPPVVIFVASHASKLVVMKL